LYRSTCRLEIKRRLRSEDLSLRGLTEAIGATFISPDEIAEVADPVNTFLNVNTTAERDRAEALLDSFGP
jgi:molybdopterin-guanine dinucleotide biosynthesis protein A